MEAPFADPADCSDLRPRQRRSASAHRLQRRDPAVDAHREPLGHERGRPGCGLERVLDHHRLMVVPLEGRSIFATSGGRGCAASGLAACRSRSAALAGDKPRRELGDRPSHLQGLRRPRPLRRPDRRGRRLPGRARVRGVLADCRTAGPPTCASRSAATCGCRPPPYRSATPSGMRDEGATCSTSGWSAPRCSTSPSARASSTAG